MAKVRLLLWSMLLACAAFVLLRTVTWPDATDPAVTTMAVIRIVAGVLALYLLAATVLAVRLPRVAPRFVQRLVAAAVGGGLLLAPMAASAEPSRAPAVDAPVLHRIGDAPATAVAQPAPLPPPAPAATDEVVVAPGDHFWAIAERTLAARLGRPPTDAEIAPFWTRLIDANRDRLISDDPSLILPGQRFTTVVADG